MTNTSVARVQWHSSFLFFLVNTHGHTHMVSCIVKIIAKRAARQTRSSEISTVLVSHKQRSHIAGAYQTHRTTGWANGMCEDKLKLSKRCCYMYMSRMVKIRQYQVQALWGFHKCCTYPKVCWMKKRSRATKRASVNVSPRAPSMCRTTTENESTRLVAFECQNPRLAVVSRMDS